MREDLILLLFITKLKDICNRHNVFIMTSTQLSGASKGEKNLDSNVLSGAKSMANKVDLGCVVTKPSTEDLEAIGNMDSRFGLIPNAVTHVYKNRGARWKDVKVWSYIDFGTCRVIDLFLTDNNYKPIPIESTHILTYPKGTEKEDIKLSQEINQEEENKVFTNEIKSDIIENVEDKEETNLQANPEIINGDESNVISNYSQF